MSVDREDWDVEPMASSRPLDYERRLSVREADGLLKGFKPHSMDDQWFFFGEGDVVHLHRSWSGEEIFAIGLTRSTDGTAEVTEVRVNNAYPDDADAKNVLNLLFEEILPEYF